MELYESTKGQMIKPIKPFILKMMKLEFGMQFFGSSCSEVFSGVTLSKDLTVVTS